MIKLKSILTTFLSALFITCTLAVIFVQPAGAQTAGNLQCNGCVNSKDIKNKSIKSSDIKDGQVKNQDLATGAVTTGKVADNSLSALDLMDEPGVDFVGGNQTISLAGIIVVRAVSVTVPRSGTVVVSANGWYAMPGGTSGAATCMISATASFDLAAEMNVAITAPGGGGRVPFGGTRAFSVDAGTHTFRLVCFRSSASAVSVNDSYMTAMFFPTRY